MTREVISLHVGQCGNQIGSEFWKRLCQEHALATDGTLQDAAAEGQDARDVFFSEADDGRYTPRALLFDLEPRVAHLTTLAPLLTSDALVSLHGDLALWVVDRVQAELRDLFNPESIYIAQHGGGAGNNWASGYDQAVKAQEDILDMLEREARNSDSLQGFLLTHSIAGGTGSGMGSLLLETLSDHFPKALVHTYSVFPHRSDDVVVEPYNSVLTLKRLKHHADAVTVLDNPALDGIASQQLGHATPSVDQINSLAALAMAATTATLRFQGPLHNSMADVLAPLIPAPFAHFLLASAAPLSDKVRASSVPDVMQRLLARGNCFASPSLRKPTAKPPPPPRLLGAVDILQGEVDLVGWHKGLVQLRERGGGPAFAFPHAELQLVHARASPHLKRSHRVSGVMLANSTAVRHIFDRTLGLYDRLMERKAFVSEYEKFPMFSSGEGRRRIANLDEFDESREEVASLSAAYKSLESAAETR